jgi:predicted nuclease of restriction endonuclease-like RecB superfamily
MRSSDRSAEIVPPWLTPGDRRWVEVLAEAYACHVGNRRGELDSTLLALELEAPRRAVTLVCRVLDRLHAPLATGRASGPELRARVFAESADDDAPPERVLARVAGDLGVPAAELAERIFADLPSERRLAAARENLTADDLCRRANRLLLQRLLTRAWRVRVRLAGDPRPVVRCARRLGLMGVLTGPDDGGSCTLSLLGPEVTRPRQAACARAVAELLPEVTGRAGFELVADLGGRGCTAVLRVDDSAPLPLTPAGPHHDWVRQFLDDLPRGGPDCLIDVYPEPERACGELFVPDFGVLASRATASLFVEVIERWTADWLRNRVTRLKAAERRDVQLWVRCDAGDALPAEAQLVPFRHRRELPALFSRAVAAIQAPGLRRDLH